MEYIEELKFFIHHLLVKFSSVFRLSENNSPKSSIPLYYINSFSQVLIVYLLLHLSCSLTIDLSAQKVLVILMNKVVRHIILITGFLLVDATESK